MLADTQDGLVISQNIQGYLVINNNDLSRRHKKDLDDQSYYLILTNRRCDVRSENGDSQA